MHAIILAAGMGNRLKEFTRNNTKCMVKVNGVTLIERMLKQLDQFYLSKIVLVIGYKGAELVDFVQTLDIKTPICFIENSVYDKTNNIYSLFLAKDYLLEDDTILLESDLICEDRMLCELIENPYPNLALVAKFESWMDGTVVKLDEENHIREFLSKSEFVFSDIPSYYKTVNIYKFSQKFSQKFYVPFLEAYCKALGRNRYYEQVLKVITLLNYSELKALPSMGSAWYEIDDVQDLDIAESIFANSSEKLKKLQIRYGGYWRYPKIQDFCYLVNPYYPPKNLISEIKANFERLISHYPSGANVNALLAAKNFDLKPSCVCVGNGAAELIKSLMGILSGKIGLIFPTFEEYPNRIEADRIIAFQPFNDTCGYNEGDLIKFFEKQDLSVLLLINPDNPSGNYIPIKGVMLLLQWARKKKIRLVIDESFIDFVNEDRATFLVQDLLETFPELIVVKSISKSFGVPGLRLGLIASSDVKLVEKLKKDLSIWNINSFGEFYLQIAEKYKDDYERAIVQIKQSRSRFLEKLSILKHFRVIPSQANYFMVQVLAQTATSLAEKLVEHYNILIKDLTGKRGIPEGEFIRIAVKSDFENDLLVNALSQLTDENNQTERNQ